jgi:hypothetical protein
MTALLSAISGGVATARGFRAAGISAGIKANGNPDLALIVSDAVAQIAAVYTTNKVLAAPVVVSKEHLERSGGIARAIVVNRLCELVHRRHGHARRRAWPRPHAWSAARSSRCSSRQPASSASPSRWTRCGGIRLPRRARADQGPAASPRTTDRRRRRRRKSPSADAGVDRRHVRRHDRR